MTGDVIPLRFHDIEEGDIVRLKEGGPLLMVGVADAAVAREITVVWLVSRRLHTGVLLPTDVDLVLRGSPLQ
ncbi:MAG: hypothetical protein WA047_20500 [Phenylobacterium sp.]|uniref:hypothetical protein n=1 Tax=Phenylobacterium sp. TaxID=1871053 RepID=UPI003BB645D4